MFIEAYHPFLRIRRILVAARLMSLLPFAHHMQYRWKIPGHGEKSPLSIAISGHCR
jgi:hypothetical protein